MRTLVIINTKAAGGKAEAVFRSVEARMAKVVGELSVALTYEPEEVAGHLDRAAAAGIDRVIAVGGDGTNNSLVNALAGRPGLSVSLGILPVGTGTDWARALGIPSDPSEAVEWLATAKPVPCDLGKAEYIDLSRGGLPSRRFFLNIASAGVSGEIVARVNKLRRRTALSFLRATIGTLFRYRPQRVIVECDGIRYYEGPTYLLAVANGQFFGRGMWVAPNALADDGLFDIVLVEGMPRIQILLALRTVFSGKHLERTDVHSTRAAAVKVHSEDGPLGLDFDGEEAQGQDLNYTLLPKAVRILLHPTATGVLRSVAKIS